MQAQPASRKRPAPGASPMVPHQQPSAPQPGTQYPQVQDFTEDQFNNFTSELGNAANQYSDPTAYDSNIYSAAANAAQPQIYGANIAPAPLPQSNQLVRRNTNQQLAARRGGHQQDHWNVFGNNPGPTPDRAWENMDEDERELDQRAAVAKKDAQAKRKQIPPFVQKLWSFLDSTQNTELIRWSDDGQSFIVLDEDEFARTLIPELFKHNNYASFVRQLNMYGFHKRVGLNANSMKAAEKKVKDPSVYWHEYFQRGRPELLWLIQKPASKSGGSKRKRDGIKTQDHGESDDEARRASPEADEASRPVPVRGQSQDLVTVPRSEVSTLRQEVQKLQRQQSVISKMIAQLKEQNEQFYRQATAFQALHDRHENSINAILTFLATFYNRSLDGTGPNMMNMFGNAIPQQNQQQGSVVDVGDVAEGSTESSNRLQRYRRQPLALLPPPAAAATSGQTLRPPGSAFTAPNSARTSVSPPNEATTPRNASAGARSSISTQPPPASVSPAIKDDAPTPDLLNSFPESDDMMSLINNVNANSGSPSNVTGNPAFDFNSALDHYQNANGNTPLTPQERDSVLSMIAGSQPGTNNALTSPNPPPMPSLDGLAQTKQQLDMLAKLQQEQDSKVADLAGRLQPLSPTGAIPGLPNAPSLSNDPNLYDDLGAPGAFDLNEFLNDNTNNNYFNFPTSGTGDSQNVDFATVDNANLNIDDTGLNWDFNTGNNDVFGEPQEQASSGRVESVSSEATSPATVKAESDRVEGETPPKRRKVGA